MKKSLRFETIDRRQFIRRCAASAFSVSTLPTVVSSSISAAPTQNLGPGFGSAKNVIFLMVQGGLTQIDTLDPKEGVFNHREIIGTSADTQFTSAIPNMAKIADRMCVIRSMTGKIGVHKDAQYFMRTAYKENSTIYHPMIGAYAQEILGKSHPVMPSSVSVNRGSGFGQGFLPSSHAPLPILDPVAGLQHVEPEKNIEHLKDRIAVLNKLDSKFREDYPDKNIQAYSAFYDDALRLMTGEEVQAFDLNKEPAKMREAYGQHKFGQGCLLARRLIENGVRFVEVVSEGWDFHTDVAGGLDDRGPSLDQGYSQLILDLEQRGLLDETLVVLTTEFGRNPRPGPGRGHFPTAFSVALAGAGVKRGYTYGASDKEGRRVEENAMTAGDLHATIGYAMGIAPGHDIMSPSGRPFRIGDKGSPVLDLMA